MSDELEDSKTDKLIAAKRHKELTERLDKVTTALTKKPEPKIEEKKDDGILNAITQLSRDILSLPKPEKPLVNVELNQDKLATAIMDLESKVDKVIEGQNKIIKFQEKILHELTIMTQPKRTVFDVKKNQYTGSLESVESVSTYIQPKARA